MFMELPSSLVIASDSNFTLSYCLNIYTQVNFTGHIYLHKLIKSSLITDAALYYLNFSYYYQEAAMTITPTYNS